MHVLLFLILTLFIPPPFSMHRQANVLTYNDLPAELYAQIAKELCGDRYAKNFWVDK